MKRAVALTAELAAQSEKKVVVVCNHPPGLRDERAKHTAAPKMGAGGSHLRPKWCNPHRPPAYFSQQEKASSISREDSVEDDHGQPHEPNKQEL